MDFKIILLLLVPTITIAMRENKNYTLEQVFIFGRHNLRTPLGEHLDQLTRKKWPRWREKRGHLTDKGKRLEGYMGKYIGDWLYREGFLPERCPKSEDLYVYANTQQRTLDTARTFVDKAFPRCNVPVDHYYDLKGRDPIFNNFILNKSTVFLNGVEREIQKKLDNYHLTTAYEDLEYLLDYQSSNKCRHKKICHLYSEKTEVINVKVHRIPRLSGALDTAFGVVDYFLMEYYEGLPFKDVAWGQMTDKLWDSLAKIMRAYNNAVFDTRYLVRHTSEPLIKFMADKLTDWRGPKLSVVVGHDTNIYTILNFFRFRAFSLPSQNELTPIGGKLVFQRWYDRINDRNLLKINYVYQTSLQIRNGERLTVDNPPMFAIMEMADCKIDADGFCLWSDFRRILDNFNA